MSKYKYYEVNTKTYIVKNNPKNVFGVKATINPMEIEEYFDQNNFFDKSIEFLQFRPISKKTFKELRIQMTIELD